MIGGETRRRFTDHLFRVTLKRRYRPEGVRCPIVLYHGVDESGGPWSVTPGRFRRQIEWLSRTFDVLTLSDAADQWQDGTLPANPAVVTFDDGLRSTVETALPILEEHDVQATHYLVPEMFGERFEGARVMDSEDAAELVARGQEVGAHTMTHPDLTTLDRAELRREVRAPRKALQAITGEPPASFAYPYGAFDSECVRCVREADYETATTVIASDVVDFAAPFSLARIPVMRQHDLSAFTRLLDGDRRWQRLLAGSPSRMV